MSIAKHDAIYTIMVCTKIAETIHKKTKEDGTIVEKPTGFPDFGDCRVVGFYHEKDNAIDTVKQNGGDIYETCYDYAIVEKVEPGLYSCATERWVFKHNRETDGYDLIDEPAILKHACGLTIG